MRKIKLSLKPLQQAVWRTHEPTGTEYLIAPMSAAADQEATDHASNMMGGVNHLVFAHYVAPKIIKDWRGPTDGAAAAACNEENLKLFVDNHGLTLMPWIIRCARSLDNYRSEEVEEAKKD